MVKKIICLGVMLIMLFSFSACNKITQEETGDMIELNTWFFNFGVSNTMIKLKHSDENAVFLNVQLTKDIFLMKTI